MLGVSIYPSAVYLTSYDAGRGQRFYIFGATVPYVDLVGFYRTALKQKGEELFEAPPTHQFETAKFRDEVMAFAPSVTIKDYTYGGSAGYPNPKPNATPLAGGMMASDTVSSNAAGRLQRWAGFLAPIGERRKALNALRSDTPSSGPSQKYSSIML